jgi:hypothetical protein
MDVLSVSLGGNLFYKTCSEVKNDFMLQLGGGIEI